MRASVVGDYSANPGPATISKDAGVSIGNQKRYKEISYPKAVFPNLVGSRCLAITSLILPKELIVWELNSGTSGEARRWLNLFLSYTILRKF